MYIEFFLESEQECLDKQSNKYECKSKVVTNGIYDINLWDITDEQINMAIDVIDEFFPGFKNAGF